MQWGQGPGLSLHDLGESGGEPTVTLLADRGAVAPARAPGQCAPRGSGHSGPAERPRAFDPAFVYKQPSGAATPQPLAAGIMGHPQAEASRTTT